MSNADFVVTSGILGAASLRVGARQLLPRAPRWTRRVSDDEASEFVASLAPSSGIEAQPAVGSSERLAVLSAR